MNAPERKCPVCSTVMTPGTCEVRGTFWGFLMFGLSHQHFWFNDAQSKKIIVASDDICAGYRCSKCGSVLVQPRRDQMKDGP